MGGGVGVGVDREVALQLHLEGSVERALHLVRRMFGLELNLRRRGVDDGEVVKLGVVGDEALELTIYAMSVRFGADAAVLAHPSGPTVPGADGDRRAGRQRKLG